MAWVLSKQKEESNWIIPLKEILYQKDDFEKASVGIIKIKVSSYNNENAGINSRNYI